MPRWVLTAALAALVGSSAPAQPVIDGVINPTEGYTLLGTSEGGPASSFGSGNQLNAIYAAVDGTHLYLAIAGNVTNDRMLVFIDSKQGGVTGGNYNRSSTGGGLPAAVQNFNYGHSFDPGFTADYAIDINRSGDTYFADLVELRGTFNQGPVSSVCFLGAAQPTSPATRFAASPALTPTDYVNGFELRLPLSSTSDCASGALETSLSDRTSVSVFAMISARNSFLSNHFLSPASASQTESYGFTPQNFGAADRPQDPLSFVWQTALYNPTSGQGDGAGWRHLASPVIGLDVHDLAQINLVQGVPAGTHPPQYPFAADNVYVTYDPEGEGALSNGFVPPASTDHTFGSGRGFFWYLYDNNVVPPNVPENPGTSRSFELSSFVLRAGGLTPRANVTASFPFYFDESFSNFYLIGNPFALPLAAAGITSSPARQSVLQVYDPATGGYSACVEAVGVPPCRTHLDVWQGAFAEVDYGPVRVAGDGRGLGATFTYAFAQTSDNPALDPGFVGRETATPMVRFALQGSTAAGTLADQAAIVRFLPDALDMWDVHDASKLVPPSNAYALLAPVLLRDGAPYRTAVNSLTRDRAAAAAVPVAFTTTHAGAFTISWEGLASMPEEWRAELRDLATGAVTTLAEGGSYAFEADAVAWTDRFELVVGPANIVAGEEAPGLVLALAPVRPNPAAGTARATLATGPATHARVVVVDALGRVVATVLDGAVPPNASLDLAVDTRTLAPGAYVLRAESHGQVLTRSLTVVR